MHLRFVSPVLVVVAIACGSASQTDKVEALGDRACECAKQNEMNFSVESIQAATDARLSGVNRGAECARPVVADVIALADGSDVKAEGGPAIKRLGRCLAESGVEGVDIVSALRKLGY
jgi:hypothetical protein